MLQNINNILTGISFNESATSGWSDYFSIPAMIGLAFSAIALLLGILFFSGAGGTIIEFIKSSFSADDPRTSKTAKLIGKIGTFAFLIAAGILVVVVLYYLVDTFISY